MILIAVCDDVKATCFDVKSMCEKYCREDKEPLICDTYFSEEDLIKRLKYGSRYNIIFLDINIVKKASGIDVGLFIRDELHDNDTQIVYMSADKEYALDLFQIRPFDFLVKPIEYEHVADVIGKYLDIFNDKNAFFEFISERVWTKVRVADIVYFERLGRQTVLTTNKEKYILSRTINELEKDEIFKDRMLRPHNSFLVSKAYVRTYKMDCIFLENGAEIPISRSRKSEVNEFLLSRTDF